MSKFGGIMKLDSVGELVFENFSMRGFGFCFLGVGIFFKKVVFIVDSFGFFYGNYREV